MLIKPDLLWVKPYFGSLWKPLGQVKISQSKAICPKFPSIQASGLHFFQQQLPEVCVCFCGRKTNVVRIEGQSNIEFILEFFLRWFAMIMVLVVMGVQTWKPASTWAGDELEEPDKQGPEEEQVHLVLAPLVQHQPQQQPVRPHPVLLSHCLWCSHHESTFVIWVFHKSIAGHDKRYTYFVVVNGYPISYVFSVQMIAPPPPKANEKKHA